MDGRETYDDEVENAFYYDSRGGILGHVFVDIYTIFGDQPLTSFEADIISNAARKMIEDVTVERMRNDPKLKKQKEDWLKEAKQIFTEAGFTPIYIYQIANEYDRIYGVMDPWLLVTTRLGVFKFGWRKRVLHLEWTDTVVRKLAENLFPDEDVTKNHFSIHCWGREKAVEYLKRINDLHPEK
jgi:hypothetical protein